MSYKMEEVRALGVAEFRRLLGVRPPTFEAMLEVLQGREAAKKKRGRPADLSLEEQLLLALQSSGASIAPTTHLAMEWRVAENTVCRTIKRVEDALIKSGAFALPGRKRLAGSAQSWSVVAVDVAEHPVERPKKSRAPATRARRSATR